MNQQISSYTVDVLSKLLARENITIKHSPTAKTACFDNIGRVLTFPIYDHTLSSDSLIALALHETGHAKYTTLECNKIADKYGMGLVNILEDARIENKCKQEYVGSKKYFVKGYRDLVIENNFFDTAKKDDPFDFTDKNFLSRLNCWAKLGRIATVNFNKKEQEIADKVMAIETLADLERVAKEIADLVETPPPPPPQEFTSGNSEDASSESEDESEDGNSGYESDDESGDDNSGSESEDESEDDNSSDESEDESEDDNSGSAGDESEDDGDSEDESEDGSSGDESEDESEDDGDSGDESEDGNSGDKSEDDNSSDESEDESEDDGDFDSELNENFIDLSEDDLDSDESVEASKKALENSLGDWDGTHTFIPTDNEIPDEIQPWTDISYYVDGYASPETLKKFKEKIKPVISKMVSEFNRNAAGAVRNRTFYKDTGAIDTIKMVHYRYNENIFKRHKFVRDGKNHGVILMVDGSSSMYPRIRPMMEQTVAMVEFCRKINIPFRVYRWTTTYLPSNSGKYNKLTASSSLSRRARVTEILSSDMPDKTLDKYLSWCLLDYGIAQGGTPLMQSLWKIFPVLSDWRKNSRIDQIKLIVLSDGQSGDNLPFAANDNLKNVYTDSQTGKSYRISDYIPESTPHYSIYRTMGKFGVMHDIIHNRYGVDASFIFLGSLPDIKKTMLGFTHGTSFDEKLTWLKYEEANPIRLAFNKSFIQKIPGIPSSDFGIITIRDGYRFQSTELNMKVDSDNRSAIRKEFLKSTSSKAESRVFASLVAKAIAR